MNKSIKKQSITRLRLVLGQVRGIEKMVERGKYCIDILHQSMAAKAALSSFEDFILKNHLSTHVVEQMRSRNPKRAVREIQSIYRLSKRK
ncbi:metal-sensitive transcriptional regulator [Candidatus Parcubacteria bacterium]|nr:MAG: metal-sensitive transcriptional regulator [Candidatus Parcubacteria bacterium]